MRKINLLDIRGCVCFYFFHDDVRFSGQENEQTFG